MGCSLLIQEPYHSVVLWKKELSCSAPCNHNCTVGELGCFAADIPFQVVLIVIVILAEPFAIASNVMLIVL